MESTTKKVILPTKGICNTSPDKICDDSELLDSVGLTYFNDALRPIQKTVITKTLTSGTLQFVHRLNDGTTVNYITTSGSSLYWGDAQNEISIGSNITSVESVGNTLIVNAVNGLNYFLWKPSESTYISLGNKIPFPQLRFQLNLDTTDSKLKSSIHYTEFGCDIRENNTLVIAYGESDDHYQAFSDRIIADYAKLRNEAAEKSGFVFPFFVRYAMEMYDGTYLMPSNPILVCPSLTTNFSMLIDSSRNDFLTMSLRYFKLQYKNISTTDYSKWSDIIKKIVIFASYEINLYNLDNIYSPELSVPDKERRYYNTSLVTVWDNPDAGPITEFSFSSLLKKRTAESVNKDIETTSVFYRIAEVDLKSQSSFTNVPIIDKVLKNLTTQTTLVNSVNGDDYYAHCIIKADNTYTFNRRLNVTNALRNFFEGFKQFGPVLSENDVNPSTPAKVFINTPNGMVYVTNNITVGSFDNYGYFYYPDPRAEYVSIGTYTYKLKKHPGLNGVYCYAGIDGSGLTRTNEPSATEGTWERLNNYLLQSEVDNPFTFFATGYVRVGQGTILGMAGLTTALSQDAYKISTTIVFTTQGIWALTINSEGQYASVPPPFSREVCNNPDSITMVDNAVFFTSEKGLMCIVEDSVKCVSAHLAGKNPQGYSAIFGDDFTSYSNFLAFLKGCKIAYDYRNSQLILTNNSVSGGSSVYPYHWVYNITTGTFSRFVDSKVYKAVVSDYPDTLLQDTSGAVHSLINKPNINTDTNKYNATLITRPMKFEQSVKLKTIRELLHITDLHEATNDRADITLKIFASNDCRTWHEIESLHGRGFKYFIFRYDFTDMIATDSFSGSIIGYDLRNTDKLR